MNHHSLLIKDWLERDKQLLISVSGIRGTVPQGLDPENIVQFIRAFAQISNQRIVVGRDTRTSSPLLHQLTIATLIAAGKEVYDLGIVPTPTVKCMVQLTKTDGGIMITASHNPMEWNGFKFIDENGFFFDEKQQAKWLHALGNAKTRSQIYVKEKKLGRCLLPNPLSQHLESVLKFLSSETIEAIRKKAYPVIVDAVNGAGSKALPALLEALGCRVFPLHCEPNHLKAFPRSPEPNSAALSKLARLVKKHKAAIGFGLDPDGDRLAIASYQREAIHEEYTLPLALLGMRHKLMKKETRAKSKAIVVNLSTSRLCDRIAQDYCIKVFRSAVGEANVVRLMQKKKAIFGGEGNGGVIIPDIPSYGRDPLIGAALILTAMAREKLDSVDSLMDQLPPLFMHKSKYQLKSSYSDKGDPTPVGNIADKLLLEFPEGKANYEDGLHLLLKDHAWIHLRTSNTEPVVRLIAEAPNQNRLESIIHTAKKVLAK